MIGTNGNRIVLGFMIATAFLSMWISNTATTLMMLPIGLAITRKISEFSDQNSPETIEHFNKSLMIAIAYAATIGGMATLIGSPTNAIFSAVSMQMYNAEVTFFSWFSFGLPFAIILLFVGWTYLTKVAFKMRMEDSTVAREEIDRNLKSFGRMNYEEKAVAIVFAITALAWILRSFVLEDLLPGIDDTVIAVSGAVVLFLIPSRQNKGEFLMTWEAAAKLPWGILILFGGGLAIAVGFRETGLAEWAGDALSSLEQYHFAIILFSVIVMVNFFTEITSNVATSAVMMPILAALSQSIGVHPFGLMMGASIASSCAFMLPVATPPNAIVYSSNYLSIGDMVRAGFWMNMMSSSLLFLFIYFVLPVILGIDLMTFPF
jgi:sodium-dependent dicarboxylate transporter 2/3/5